MDNRLGEMEAFLQVVRRGSFAAAARALRQTPSAVSRAVARLEARLGVALLRRTTRSLILTPEGETYREQAAALMEDLDAIERTFTESAAEPSGRLRVNASVPFGTHVILPILPRFLAAHPRMSLDLTLTDEVIDLAASQADVAIRIGPLRDTRLRARSLGRSRMAVVAAPGYLAEHGIPEHPDDLARHNCFNFSFRRSLDTWPFRVGSGIGQRPIQGNFFGNSGEVVRLMALGGAGIARLALFHVASDLAAGRLVPVLEAFNPGDAEDVHALYVGHARLSGRTRAFVDFLAAHATVSA
ncbi:LysR family transcriptional regulator [Methylobacterium dankookense]|uniref:HTH-type transcriptional regulator DmlR n=1 Tax=Methylobacterium dankookense TaxID=560405 RepID=A0A564G1B3_9HYPH|nr:LysR family transcriptional regulator [Methylobacterium dankookense]GJD54800.1 HTH-type transcriptional regulator DmlR [Methylobacterium dankookense]VUF14273.1 HTH-type transcriptional regulator DmlR [Methylobacterium dankookense]